MQCDVRACVRRWNAKGDESRGKWRGIIHASVPWRSICCVNVRGYETNWVVYLCDANGSRAGESEASIQRGGRRGLTRHERDREW